MKTVFSQLVALTKQGEEGNNDDVIDILARQDLPKEQLEHCMTVLARTSHIVNFGDDDELRSFAIDSVLRKVSGG